jgi:hypothetical protein
VLSKPSLCVRYTRPLEIPAVGQLAPEFSNVTYFSPFTYLSTEQNFEEVLRPPATHILKLKQRRSGSAAAHAVRIHMTVSPCCTDKRRLPDPMHEYLATAHRSERLHEKWVVILPWHLVRLELMAIASFR